MARLVPDASATLTWCFEDEARPWTDALLAQLRAGDEAIVPVHWPAEFSERTPDCRSAGPDQPGEGNQILSDLSVLPIRVDPESSQTVFDKVFKLAEQHSLTVYDASYLESAMREGLPPSHPRQ